jgi:hypothetical protein
MLILALFTIARFLNQPRYPLMNELTFIYMCIYIYVYTHTMEFYSVINYKIMSFAGKMDGTGDHHVK